MIEMSAKELRRRREWLASVGARLTPRQPRLGTTLGDLLAMEAADIRPLLPDDHANMQTEAYWREVWGVA